MSKKILVVDDEAGIQETLKGALSDEGYQVFTASSGKEGLSQIQKNLPDIVFLDIWMEGMDGLEVLAVINEKYPSLTVIMMSGHGTIETAVKATKLGAYDFVEKPLSLERILVLLKNISQAQDMARENRTLREQIKTQKFPLGKSKGIENVREMIKRVAPTTGSVLITGENGTGKEVVAQSIHAHSERRKKTLCRSQLCCHSRRLDRIRTFWT